MDSSTSILVYKDGLRFLYAADIPGLRALITELMAPTGPVQEGVMVTQLSHEGGQASGQVVLKALEKLAAAMDLLRELDPDNVPALPASTRYGDWSRGCLET